MPAVPSQVAAFRAASIDLAYLTSLLIEAANMAREHASYEIDASPDVQSMMTRTIDTNLFDAIAATERALRAFREHAETLDEHYEDEIVGSHL